MLKILFFFFGTLFLFRDVLHAQNIDDKSAPHGFDSLRTEIPHGRIDTIMYASKTVGTNRRAIIE
jgi:hypothetical protein